MTANEIAIRKSDEEFGNFHSRAYLRLKDALPWEGLIFLDAYLATADEKNDLFIDDVHFVNRVFSALVEYMTQSLMRTSSVLKRNCKAVK